MNLLGVDYGKKKIGLAMATLGVDLVLPVGQIGGGEEKLRRAQVIKTIKDKKIDKIIVGYPYGLKGEENENTDRVNKFVAQLKNDLDIEVELVDERFTSRQADQMGGTVSRDERAAMVILQSYLDKQK